ncbi:MAG: hypothetical protein ACKOOI_17715 [Pirellula sp.]
MTRAVNEVHVVNPVRSQHSQSCQHRQCRHKPAAANVNTYEDALKGPATWAQAKLGPEDIRFLKMLRQMM